VANIFNAITTGIGGIATTADSSGSFAFAKDGSTVATISGTGVINASAITGLTTALTVAQGGTGATSLAANNVILGNNTSAVQEVAPGTSGNVLTSNGTTWTSAAAPAGGFGNMQVFASSGTFTVPAGITKVKVTVVGGGGNGGGTNTSTYVAGGGGGGGGGAIEIVTGLTPAGTVTVTVGGAGGTSSFGAYCSATGGSNGTAGNATNQCAPGGAGGLGSGGDLNIRGGSGSWGIASATNFAQGGNGGSSILGGGATQPTFNTSGNGTAGGA
jgi:hypothetical protein